MFAIELVGNVQMEYRLDNSSPNGFSSNFVGDVHRYAVGGSRAVSTNRTTGGVATYTFDGLTPGNYAVYATWISDWNNRNPLSTSAPFTISGGTAATTVNVNQQISPNDEADGHVDWEWLQNYTIVGGRLVVTLNDNDRSSAVQADSIRIVHLYDPKVEIYSGGERLNTQSDFDFGTTPAGTAVTKQFTVHNPSHKPLWVNSLGDLPLGFTQSGFVPQFLPPSANMTFSVTFTAPAMGTFGGVMALQSSDASLASFDLNLVAKAASEAIVLDDRDAAFRTISGRFSQLDRSGLGLIGNTTSYSVLRNTVGQWSVTGLTPGIYRVSTTWLADRSAASNAPFTLGGGVPRTVLLDQRNSPTSTNHSFTDEQGNVWVDLDDSYLISGTSLTVQLSNVGVSGRVQAEAIRIERVGGGDPLRAALAPITVDMRQSMSQVTADRLLQHALNLWSSQPETAFGVGTLDPRNNVRIIVDDLPGDLLGLASPSTHTIWIDNNAAGHGWSIDADLETYDAEHLAAHSLHAWTGHDDGRFDALSVVLHELGHLAGLTHDDHDVNQMLMSETLPANVRRLPGISDDLLHLWNEAVAERPQQNLVVAVDQFLGTLDSNRDEDDDDDLLDQVARAHQYEQRVPKNHFAAVDALLARRPMERPQSTTPTPHPSHDPFNDRKIRSRDHLLSNWNLDAKDGRGRGSR